MNKSELETHAEKICEYTDQIHRDCFVNGYVTGAMKREQKIADLKANCDLAIEGRDLKIKELEKLVEKMKCCGNCIHRHYWGNELGCNLDLDKQFECDNNNKKYWEFSEE